VHATCAFERLKEAAKPGRKVARTLLVIVVGASASEEGQALIGRVGTRWCSHMAVVGRVALPLSVGWNGQWNPTDTVDFPL
jgi:hypothetical protein